MRRAYLRPRHSDGGCRGGVSYDHGEGYELEIDGNADCSPEMMALAAHYDEIMIVLEKLGGPLGWMVKLSIDDEAKRLAKDL